MPVKGGRGTDSHPPFAVNLGAGRVASSVDAAAVAPVPLDHEGRAIDRLGEAARDRLPVASNTSLSI